MSKFYGLSVIFVLFLLISPVFAITDEEEFRAFSLNLSTPGARALGMGGAFIGRADDATAVETNPAGLTILARPEISVEYHHSNRRSLRTSIFDIPIRNFDVTPTPPAPEQDPGNQQSLADFQANDTLHSVDAVGFASIVIPVKGVTFAVSRHELINSDASLVGGLTASPFHYLESNDFSGRAEISDVNYNFALATKLGDVVSIGGTIKVSDFDFSSLIAARQKAESTFGQHFVSRISRRDQKVGFNAGILVRPTGHVSVGLVYKYEPEFTFGTLVNNTDRNPPLIVARKVKFNVPDTLGFGVSVAPTSNLTLNFDVVRLFYSQLENVDTGFSLFTHLLPTPEQQASIPGSKDANIIEFRIKDATDYRAGAEYLVLHRDYVFAFRAGYYRQHRNRFFLGFAPNESVREFLSPIFGTGAGHPFDHLTLGSGLTYGNFQLDFAVDLSKKEDLNTSLEQLVRKQEFAEGGVDLIISSVVRF